MGDLQNLNFIRYRRKSSEGDERQVASLQDQAEALNDIAHRLELSPAQVISDVEEAKSAKEPGRPGFNRELLEPIQRGEANAILCWHPDRLSRNAIDTAALVNLMDLGRLKAIVTNQQVFWGTPMDKFMLALLCGQAKLENDNKGVNVRRGLEGKIRKGWRPGVAPIGYINDKTCERGERSIIIDPDRFPLVRKVWEGFLTGNFSVREIQKIAADEIGLRTRPTRRQGGKPLSLSATYRLLSDPFYYGAYWWKDQHSESRRLVRGRHAPMVTEEEYRRVQHILGHTVKPQSKSHLFTYRGLIRCGECGCAITAEEKWHTVCGRCHKKYASQNRDTCPNCSARASETSGNIIRHYVYYHCTKKKGDGCEQRGIRSEELEAQIDQILRGFAISERYLRWATSANEERMMEDGDERRRRDTIRLQDLARVQNELDEIHRFIIKQEVSGWQLIKREETIKQRDRIERTIHELEYGGAGDRRTVREYFDASAKVYQYAARARFWFNQGSSEEKRAIVQALGSNLILRDKKVSVELAFPLEEIRRMIEIAPEISSTFEPQENHQSIFVISTIREKIPALLRGRNAVRTFLAEEGKEASGFLERLKTLLAMVMKSG